MTFDEIAELCSERINNKLTKVLLVVPGKPPRGRRVRLDRTSRRKCPMGEVANWQDNPPRTVAYFDAVDVLAWMVANGHARVMGGPK